MNLFIVAEDSESECEEVVDYGEPQDSMDLTCVNTGGNR